VKLPLIPTFWLVALACLACPIRAAWLDESAVDRMARDIAKLKFPLAYEAALAVLGTKEVQAALVQRTTYSTEAPGKDTPFVTQILFTDPAAAKGYFTLVVFGNAKAPIDTAARTVQKLQVRFAMPRGPVRGPLQCDGGYRQLALAPLLPAETLPKPDKDGIIWADKVGSASKKADTGNAAKKPDYHWLDFAAAERVVREIQNLKFPIPYRTALALLAPSDGDRALPKNAIFSAGTLDAQTREPIIRSRATFTFTMTDNSSPDGFFRLEMSGDPMKPGTPKEEQRFDQIAVAYYMPHGPINGPGRATGGYRKFLLLPDAP
jgi:hypothetical protein